MQLTEEENKDSMERQEKGLKALADLEISATAQVVAINTGNDVFALKVIPILKDLKYADKLAATEEAK